MGATKQYFVYMVANQWLSVLYIGVTSSLHARIWQHKHGTIKGFTKTYNCDRLVYFEMYDEIDQAIAREKQIKRWSRVKKERLIDTTNPTRSDLAVDWYTDTLHSISEQEIESPPAVSSRPSEASGGIPSQKHDARVPAGGPSTPRLRAPLGMTRRNSSLRASERERESSPAVSSRPSEASGGTPSREHDVRTSLGNSQSKRQE
jgi:putative endonuclease